MPVAVPGTVANRLGVIEERAKDSQLAQVVGGICTACVEADLVAGPVQLREAFDFVVIECNRKEPTLPKGDINQTGNKDYREGNRIEIETKASLRDAKVKIEGVIVKPSQLEAPHCDFSIIDSNTG